MVTDTRSRSRRGVVLPLVALMLVALLGMVALAVDLGVMALARTEAQNAADVAAMAAARTLNGDVSATNNFIAAGTTGVLAGAQNQVLGEHLGTSQVAVELGSYTYDSATDKFDVKIPRATGDNYSLARVTIQGLSRSTYFGRIFGMNQFNTTATATAVHRPRDVAIILDFSGSMRFDSLLGIGYTGSRTMSGNPETVFPLFGQYSSSAAALQNPNNSFTNLNGTVYGPANLTATSASGSPVVDNFYQHASGSTSTKAFNAAPDSYASNPGGDHPLKTNNNTGAAYAKTITELVGSTSRNPAFELDGYAAYNASLTTQTDYTEVPFAGYTQGPRYWGKTFFIWPPDPRKPLGASDQAFVKQFLADFGFTALDDTNQPYRHIWASWPWPKNDNSLTNYLQNQCSLPTSDPKHYKTLRLHNRPLADWRTKFFWKSNGSTPVDENLLLFDGPGVDQGHWRNPIQSGTVRYRINYDAILAWIKSGPNPFPPRLRSGRILYYDAIPDTIDTSVFPTVDPNQRFWKQYIDHVLGVRQTGTSSYATTNFEGETRSILPRTGYGDNFTWGTVSINAKPNGTTDLRYMNYDDNPERPKLHMWFGPMTLLDFLGNYNESRFWWPGTCNESPLVGCKRGMLAAIRDIENNHPNDFVSIIYFNQPQYNATDSNGRFNRVRVPLGRNYARMVDALWYPPYTIDNPGTEIRPYDTDGNGIPRIRDTPNAAGGTCPAMGLMLAFNQFSGNSGLRDHAPAPAPAGEAGGFGRKGATKIIILETDGMANTNAEAAWVNAGAYKSYYAVRQPGEYPSNSGPAVDTQVYNIADRICALDSDNNPGYSTASRPVLIHCIAFGTLFEPSTTSSDKQAALNLLQTLQYKGGKAGGEQTSTSTALASYKRIVGSEQQRIDRLREAFTRIMQSGFQVTLID